jgi:hypothetical protein
MCIMCQVEQCCATCKYSHWLQASTHICGAQDQISVAGDYICPGWDALVFVLPRLGPQVFGALKEVYVQ